MGAINEFSCGVLAQFRSYVDMNKNGDDQAVQIKGVGRQDGAKKSSSEVVGVFNGRTCFRSDSGLEDARYTAGCLRRALGLGTHDTEYANSAARSLFLNAVLEECGAADVSDLDDSVKKALDLDKFGAVKGANGRFASTSGRPLTARRIKLVLAAVENWKAIAFDNVSPVDAGAVKRFVDKTMKGGGLRGAFNDGTPGHDGEASVEKENKSRFAFNMACQDVQGKILDRIHRVMADGGITADASLEKLGLRDSGKGPTQDEVETFKKYLNADKRAIGTSSGHGEAEMEKLVKIFKALPASVTSIMAKGDVSSGGHFAGAAIVDMVVHMGRDLKFLADGAWTPPNGEEATKTMEACKVEGFKFGDNKIGVCEAGCARWLAAMQKGGDLQKAKSLKQHECKWLQDQIMQQGTTLYADDNALEKYAHARRTAQTATTLHGAEDTMSALRGLVPGKMAFLAATDGTNHHAMAIYASNDEPGQFYLFNPGSDVWKGTADQIAVILQKQVDQGLGAGPFKTVAAQFLEPVEKEEVDLDAEELKNYSAEDRGELKVKTEGYKQILAALEEDEEFSKLDKAKIRQNIRLFDAVAEKADAIVKEMRKKYARGLENPGTENEKWKPGFFITEGALSNDWADLSFAWDVGIYIRKPADDNDAGDFLAFHPSVNSAAQLEDQLRYSDIVIGLFKEAQEKNLTHAFFQNMTGEGCYQARMQPLVLDFAQHLMTGSGLQLGGHEKPNETPREYAKTEFYNAIQKCRDEYAKNGKSGEPTFAEIMDILEDGMGGKIFKDVKWTKKNVLQMIASEIEGMSDYITVTDKDRKDIELATSPTFGNFDIGARWSKNAE